MRKGGAAPILTLDDGTVINTQWCGGCDGADGISSIRFCAEDESRNRIFFDTSRVQSVAFGDLGPINLPIS